MGWIDHFINLPEDCKTASVRAFTAAFSTAVRSGETFHLNYVEPFKTEAFIERVFPRVAGLKISEFEVGVTPPKRMRI
jgi:hypothetical protein